MSTKKSSGKSLVELYDEHSGKLSDKWELYLSIYDKLFRDFRSRNVRILEIGIQNGGSLEVWAEYFPNFEKIVGCDIDETCSGLTYADDRISVVVGDATDPTTEQRIIGISGQFDIIIDDGSHESGDIIKTFARYFRHLAPGGLFVAEDLHCSYWKDNFNGGLHAPFSSISFFKRLADITNFEHWGAKATASDVLQYFSDTYDLGLDDANILSVESVLFHNSICAVSKSLHPQALLGKRVVVGKDAIVSSDPIAARGTTLVAPDQSENPWSAGLPPAEKIVANYFDAQAREAELEAQLAAARAAEHIHASRVEEILFHQAATVNGLVEQLNQLKSVIKHPVRSHLVSRTAILAANLPGLSERRRQKLRNSSRKRNLEILTKSFSTALRTLQANSVARAGQIGEGHTFLGNDLDGRPIVDAITDLDVAIVVCIHNALEDVKVCLSSIVANTRPPYRLILVDDGSRDDTKQYLEGFASAQGATLLRCDTAGGYTRAANRGLRASSAPWTVLLNSDTIVPFGWIDELLKVGESDEKIGIVGPSSNTASWQSAPLLFNEDGDWADNPLLPNVDVQEMQRLVSSVAPPQGIDLPFLNGFAFMIRRSLIEDIGIFDEETFGAGYGEENDFCIRARRAGWKLIFAPNAYVFHAQSKSYSTEKRLKLATAAHTNLCAKHDPDQHIMPQVQYCKDALAALSFRARLATMLEDTILPEVPWEGKRVAVLCPIGSAGGGGNILVQESLLMAQLGAQVWLLNMETNQTEFERNYPESPPTLYFKNGLQLKAFLQENELNFDAVIATACFSTNWVPDRFDGKSPKLGYYIQDDEPNFFKKNSPEYQAAIDTYEFLERACGFTKTNWNADAIEKRGFPRPAVIGASVDLSRFRPKGRDLNPHRPVRLAAMLRFEAEIVDRRAPDRTMRVLNRLAATYGASVDLMVFGSDLGHDRKSGLADRVIDLGRLRPDEVAILMRNVDVFLDFSMWQAMGLSAMEAMASGCTVVVPRKGGAGDFCVDGHNGLIVDSEDDDACLAAASRLIDDPDLLAKLRKNATKDICQFTQQRSARRILELLFGEAL
ncbi:MAG: glycosyltransferase [Paracoccaceae bacterium]